MSRRRARPTDPLSLWFAQVRAAQDMAYMGAQASLVMTSRLATLAREGANPTAAGRRDAERMVSEKVLAAFDGMAAAGRETAVAAMNGALGTPGATLRIAEAAARPTRRAVSRNARRMGRL